ncbi:MAG: hypothetical protein ABIA66_04525 [Candidatus Omnitrophota bacterium]
MARITDNESRKKAVLAATINKYIKKAVPISSEDLAKDFSLSSATIRSIFADLEREGYLTHPYTSGGRIPTSKGYRYYIDSLILQMELLEDEKESITKEYKGEIKRLEDILEKTPGIISTVTHYASIVSLSQWQDKLFYKGISFILEQPEFQDSNCIKFLIKLIEDKQCLLSIINREFKEKVKVYIGEELDYPEMKNCSLAVSNYSVRKKPLGRLAVLGPTRMEYNHIIPTLEYVSGVLTDLLDTI